MSRKRLSHSQLTKLLKCPSLWYNDTTDPIVGPPIGALGYGGSFHQAIQHKLQFEPLPPELKDDYTMNFLTERAMRILGEIGVKEILRVEKTYEEIGFFKGIIDLEVRLEDGSIALLDWKTTSYDYSLHHVVSSLQLTGYAWLYQKLRKVKPDWVGFLTLHKTSLEVKAFLTTRSQEEIDRWERDLLYWLEVVNGGPEAITRNPDRCETKYGRCPYYSRCWNTDGVVETASIGETE